MSDSDLTGEDFYEDDYHIIDSDTAKKLIDEISAVEHYKFELSQEDIQAILDGKVMIFTVNANEYSFVIGLKK